MVGNPRTQPEPPLTARQAQGARHGYFSIRCRNLPRWSAQRCMDQAHEQLRKWLAEFDKAASELFRAHRRQPEVRESISRADLKRWVAGCRRQVTGYLRWSLRSSRYGFAECRQGPDRYVLQL